MAPSPIDRRTCHRPRDKPLLAVLRGERRDPPPMWLMRQAGRYLPEYRALRADKGGFLDLVYDPAAAAEITLQPLKRFAFDGAILFSDILIVPHAIGQELSFVAGEGPRLAPPLVGSRAATTSQPVLERLEPIYETVRRVKADLSPETTFLGFAGSPWTVATYMVAGQGSREQAEARTAGLSRPRQAGRDPRPHRGGDGRLSVGPDRGRGRRGAIVRQLVGQPCAGRSSSAGSSPATAWIVDAIEARAIPTRPVIGFPKGAGGKLARLCRAKPGSMRSGSTRRSIRPGPIANCRRGCRCRAISIRWR